MKRLLKLYLPENQIEKLPPCVFKYAENLEVIDLSGNKIKTLTENNFSNLLNLQHFSANENDIEYLENGLFRNNLNLRKISLNNNSLMRIEINFQKIKGVELVDLRWNRCISLSFGCCKGPDLRMFQTTTTFNCTSPVRESSGSLAFEI